MTVQPSRPTVAEVRRRLASGPRLSRAQLAEYEADSRSAVRSLVRAYRRDASRRRAQTRHARGLHALETALASGGVRRIAGVDEVGMGPLAGPVVAAAVVFEPGTRIKGVDDSKKLRPEQREELVVKIRARATGIGIGQADVEEIDTINIYHASLLAMRRAVEALPEAPEYVVTDARVIPGLDLPQDAQPKADARVFSVAAASIVAKTYRDALMQRLDLEHPGYGFAKHKGYATPEHQEAVRRLGPSPIHRASYTYIKELCGEYSAAFYELCAQLSGVDCPQAVDEAARKLEECKDGLSAAEYGKLKLLATRRRRRWSG